jgi:hypothetical protein
VAGFLLTLVVISFLLGGLLGLAVRGFFITAPL